MATSGSTDFTLNRNELIEAALRKISCLDEGDPASAEALRNGAKTLNIMVKAWIAKGLNLWKYAEIVVFLNTTSQSYSLGPTGDHACLASDLVTTQLAAAALAGALTVTVDSAAGIANGDFIGVVLDDNTIHWTTVNGAPAGAVITLASGLASAASDNAIVYAYTNKVPRPTRITSARYRTSDGIETPVGLISRQTYFNYPNKSSTGRIVQVYYDPQLGNGRLYAHRVADNVNSTLRLTAQVPLEDFDALNDTPDFPQEWYEPIIYNLALRLAPDNGISLSDPSGVGPDIKEMAVLTLEDVLGFDREPTAIQFYPGSDGAEGEDQP